MSASSAGGEMRERFPPAPSGPPRRREDAPARGRGLLPRSRRARFGLLAVLLTGISFATMVQSFSWNQTSHYDLIRALNEDKTTIDAYAANTGDKVEYHGHIYSARAPGLALFSLPFYDTLNLLDAESWTRNHRASSQRPGDEMIYLIGLWGNVLPGLLLVALMWSVAGRFEPGYGAAAAVTLGLGTLVLPLSTLLFSHVFTAFLSFAAFALMLKERDGPPRPSLLAVAGLAMGYAFSSEYPTAFAGAVLGLFLLSRRDSLNVGGVLRRAGAYVAGIAVGVVPLALYNHYAFNSWTHLAYANVERQKTGFFGIGAPSVASIFTLLLDSRGLLTLSPVLIMGGVGTWLLYRRGRRAEALTITGICLCYVIYNSGYYLLFGGGFMGPRFLNTLLPFLICPLGLALKRFPGPTIALAAVSITTIVIATITHPLVGYEPETVTWVRYLVKGFFQPTIASSYGMGRGWGGIWPFLLAAGGAIVLATLATPRLNLTARTLGWGALALAAWALFAALGPTLLGIDHHGLANIYAAKDHTAFFKELSKCTAAQAPCYGRYPLRALAPIAAFVGLLALGGAWLVRRERDPAGQAPAGLSPATVGA